MFIGLLPVNFLKRVQVSIISQKREWMYREKTGQCLSNIYEKAIADYERYLHLIRYKRSHHIPRDSSQQANINKILVALENGVFDANHKTQDKKLDKILHEIPNDDLIKNFKARVVKSELKETDKKNETATKNVLLRLTDILVEKKLLNPETMTSEDADALAINTQQIIFRQSRMGPIRIHAPRMESPMFLEAFLSENDCSLFSQNPEEALQQLLSLLKPLLEESQPSSGPGP